MAYQEQKPPFKKRLISFFVGFIPRHIGNGVVLFAYEMMRKISVLIRTPQNGMGAANLSALTEHLPHIQSKKGFIEDQNNYRDMQYGKSTMQYSGCGLIAVYNILSHLPGVETPPLTEVISSFEKDGSIFGGKWGTAPGAIRDELVRRGLPVRMTSKPREFEALAERSSAMILTMFNNREDIREQLHTISITRSDEGLVAHNVYCNGAVIGPCPDIRTLLAQMHDGRVRPISLIGVESVEERADD